jgi:hypothetical protein
MADTVAHLRKKLQTPGAEAREVEKYKYIYARDSMESLPALN